MRAGRAQTCFIQRTFFVILVATLSHTHGTYMKVERVVHCVMCWFFGLLNGSLLEREKNGESGGGGKLLTGFG